MGSRVKGSPRTYEFGVSGVKIIGERGEDLPGNAVGGGGGGVCVCVCVCMCVCQRNVVGKIGGGYTRNKICGA